MAHLIVTARGALNLEQAVEFRFCYPKDADGNATEAIDAIDISMSDRSNHILESDDQGFDDLITYLQDTGGMVLTIWARCSKCRELRAVGLDYICLSCATEPAKQSTEPDPSERDWYINKLAQQAARAAFDAHPPHHLPTAETAYSFLFHMSEATGERRTITWNSSSGDAPTLTHSEFKRFHSDYRRHIRNLLETEAHCSQALAIERSQQL